MLEGIDAVKITLCRQRRHLNDVAAHFLEGFLCRSPEGRVPAVGIRVGELCVGLLVLGVLAGKHAKLE